jgi:hypothetical protein
MPGGGQLIAKIHLRGWRQIDWEKACEYTFCYGSSYYEGIRAKTVEPDECLLKYWKEGGVDGGILTYYRLPPIIGRIIRDAFEHGKDEAKEELKSWLELRSRFKG